VKSDVTLISAATVARLSDGAHLEVEGPFIVTPSARELASEKGVRIGPAAPRAVVSPVCGTCPPYRSGDARVRMDWAKDLASRIDSTLLAASATPQQVSALAEEAARFAFAAVCVNPLMVPHAVAVLGGTGPAVAAVCGFPGGATPSAIKAAEARLAEAQGATEIDMVIPVGLLLAGNWQAVRDDVAAVRGVLVGPGTLLKVIIEAPLLTEEEIVAAAVIAMEAGADFIKTGTGTCGPARPEHVRLIRQAIGSKALIKAAGGIRDCKNATSLLEAGADRLGSSHAAELMSDCHPDHA
jgi:deoxyribose-phosphate aldolase